MVFHTLIIQLSSSRIFAQDIQFGQVYNNPLYLNPALTGLSTYTRAFAYNRTQWYNLDSKYLTYQAGADHFFSDYNSAVGGYVLYDQQGSSVLRSYEVQLQYAYELPVSERLVLRAGLQPGLVSKVLDYSTLVFPDQLDANGGFSSTQANVADYNQRVNYLDMSSGIMAYNTKWWVGFSANHMNEPRQSFILNNSRLPAKFSIIGGYKKRLKSSSEHESSITPTIYYKSQGTSDQLDMGIYGIHQKHIASLWYRGLPVVKKYNPGLQNHESVIVMYGYKFPLLQACYSYDFTISKLSRAGTGGVHEISLIYYFKRSTTKKPMKTLPCPELKD